MGRGCPGGKRVLAYLELEKNTPDIHKSVIFDISAMSYLATLAFTITKRKTFTYIFVPFAQLKRLCNFFHSFWGPRPPGPCTRLCTHMYSFFCIRLCIVGLRGFWGEAPSRQTFSREGAMAHPGPSMNPPLTRLHCYRTCYSKAIMKICCLTEKSLLFFLSHAQKVGGTVPPLQKVGGTHTPRTPRKSRLW